MTQRPEDWDPELLGELDPAEQLEAERLARALDGRAERSAPTDALEAGLLLRVLEDRELSPEREHALLAELMERPMPGPVRKRQRWFGWSLLWAGVGVSALAALLLVDRGWLGESAPPASAALPEPSLELLRAQAAGLGRAGAPEYASAMADYRRAVLSSFRSPEGR